MNAGVLLAAGASRRMGRSKPLVKSRGRSFLASGLRNLWSACDTVVVVLGSKAPAVQAAVEEEIARLTGRGTFQRQLAGKRAGGSRGLEARFRVNGRWRDGMLSSVRIGLRTALAADPDLLLVLPVDHPGVRPATVQALAEAMRAALGAFGAKKQRATFAYALVPRHRRRRGHPIVLSPALARAVAADTGASDLSDAVRRNARLIGYLDCADAGILQNRNTPTRRARRSKGTGR
jgi:CTP:molybdopterin cytidylyltransferase MocA